MPLWASVGVCTGLLPLRAIKTTLEQAVERFKQDTPELSRGLLKLIQDAHKGNKRFQTAFAAFYELIGTRPATWLRACLPLPVVSSCPCECPCSVPGGNLPLLLIPKGRHVECQTEFGILSGQPLGLSL